MTIEDKTVQAQRRVILASGSPRRRLLLPIICPVDSTLSPDADETALPGESSVALAKRLAATKLEAARQVLETSPDSVIVISADTVVSIDGAPLGKPTDAADARTMLRRLRGRCHTVITGVAVWESRTNRTTSTAVATEVEMRPLDDGEIERYIERGEPFDKAGGYAIQDAELRPVLAITGCFPNVVGLPLCGVQTLLEGQATTSVAPCDLCDRAAGVLSQHGFSAELGQRRPLECGE
jgi:septum formation protein